MPLPFYKVAEPYLGEAMMIEATKSEIEFVASIFSGKLVQLKKEDLERIQGLIKYGFCGSKQCK